MEKLLNVLKSNLVCTIVMIVALVLFVWSCGGDLIGGLITAVAAVVATACIYILVKEYKKAPAAKKAVVTKKAPAKKKSK